MEESQREIMERGHVLSGTCQPHDVGLPVTRRGSWEVSGNIRLQLMGVLSSRGERAYETEG